MNQLVNDFSAMPQTSLSQPIERSTPQLQQHSYRDVSETSQMSQRPSELNESHRLSKSTFRKDNDYTVVPSEPKTTTQSHQSLTMNAKEILATSHMEILHKN